MSFNLIDHDTTNSLVVSSLKEAGIETPDLPTRKNLPTGKTTTADVVEAIRASKSADPYTDPKVQKLYIATQMQNAGGLHTTNQEAQAKEQRKVLLEAKPRFRTELAERFDHAAQTVMDRAELIGNFENLDEVRLNTDGAAKVHAAIEVQVAIEEIKKILDARTKVELIDGRGSNHGGDTAIFEYANPTVQQREHINALGGETIWNTARAGVELTMVSSSRDMSERVIAFQHEYRRIQNVRDAEARAERAKTQVR
ncbi:hypothetical protein AB0X98_06405 [Rothia koreensis]|uniref:hypothetical protein n=1 Tax=Rothia koreensis TaxID=592378 RepID=UPI003F20F1CB